MLHDMGSESVHPHRKVTFDPYEGEQNARQDTPEG